MKYLRKFTNHTAYQTVESTLDKPNVSLCVQENDIHYNSKPIPVTGKVQIFANPQCTKYADGKSKKVWARLNIDVGLGDSASWSTNLFIWTPDSQYPDDPYGVTWYVDWVSDDHSEPFSAGDIIECEYPGEFTPADYINQPQVIFE